MSIPGLIFALFIVTLGNKSQLQNTPPLVGTFSTTRQITNIGTFVIHPDANKWLDILNFNIWADNTEDFFTNSVGELTVV